MQDRVRVPKKFKIAASGGDATTGTTVPIPVTAKKHVFQASASCNITPVLYSQSTGTAQAIATGETWETTAPLSGFQCDTNCNIYYCADYE